MAEGAPFRVFKIEGGGSISLHLGDSIKGMEGARSADVDVMVTSPPYNIGKKYGVHMDSMPRDAYLSWMEDFGSAASHVLKEDGSLFLNLGGRPGDPWIPWDVAKAVSRSMKLQNVIHWVKSISIDGTASGGKGSTVTAGHFKPIVSDRFINDCQEYVFHFTHDGRKALDKLAVGVPYKDKSNIGRWKSAARDIRDRGNVWFIPYETIKSRSQRPHPATFPVRLPEMCILIHGIKGATKVMDPFMGIGATALACARLGVSFTGFEIEKAYVEEACCRLDAFFSGHKHATAGQ